MTIQIRSCILCAAALMAPIAGHAQPNDKSEEKPLRGYLGAGLIIFPSYVGSAKHDTSLVPLAFLDYKETLYIDFDRVGVRLWHSDDRKVSIGIAAEPRFGFDEDDG